MEERDAERGPQFALTHFTSWLQSIAVVRLATPSETCSPIPLDVLPGRGKYGNSVGLPACALRGIGTAKGG